MSGNTGLVEMLEDLASKAKAGEIDAFAAAFTVPHDGERHGGYALSIGDESNVMGLLGELRALEHRVCSGLEQVNRVGEPCGDGSCRGVLVLGKASTRGTGFVGLTCTRCGPCLTCGLFRPGPQRIGMASCECPTEAELEYRRRTARGEQA